MSWKYFLGLLALGASAIWLAVAGYSDNKLHLIACDVGQGDAILAVLGETQILIDGGSGSRVMECLSFHMPFWDREIELVILTHPQKDHFGGLIEVFKRYEVEMFLATGLDSSSSDYQVLKKVVGGSGAEVVNPTTGMDIRLGLIQLDILHPSEQYILSAVEGLPSEIGQNILGAFTTTRDPNDFSIVAILRFGEFDALLTGDINPKIVDEVLQTGLVDDIEYIKIPHHGSKNGLSKDLLRFSDPEIAVISVGKNNSYGHPHEEVLKILSDRDIEILRTDEMGDIEIVSDGETIWVVD